MTSRADPEGSPGGQDSRPPFAAIFLKFIGTLLKKGRKMADLHGKLSKILSGPPPFKFSGSVPGPGCNKLQSMLQVFG